MQSLAKFKKSNAQVVELLGAHLPREIKTSDLEYVNKFTTAENEWDKPVYDFTLTLRDCRVVDVHLEDKFSCDCCSNWQLLYKFRD